MLPVCETPSCSSSSTSYHRTTTASTLGGLQCPVVTEIPDINYSDVDQDKPTHGKESSVRQTKAIVTQTHASSTTLAETALSSVALHGRTFSVNYDHHYDWQQLFRTIPDLLQLQWDFYYDAILCKPCGTHVDDDVLSIVTQAIVPMRNTDRRPITRIPPVNTVQSGACRLSFGGPYRLEQQNPSSEQSVQYHGPPLSIKHRRRVRVQVGECSSTAMANRRTAGVSVGSSAKRKRYVPNRIKCAVEADIVGKTSVVRTPLPVTNIAAYRHDAVPLPFDGGAITTADAAPMDHDSEGAIDDAGQANSATRYSSISSVSHSNSNNSSDDGGGFTVTLDAVVSGLGEATTTGARYGPDDNMRTDRNQSCSRNCTGTSIEDPAYVHELDDSSREQQDTDIMGRVIDDVLKCIDLDIETSKFTTRYNVDDHYRLYKQTQPPLFPVSQAQFRGTDIQLSALETCQVATEPKQLSMKAFMTRTRIYRGI